MNTKKSVYEIVTQRIIEQLESGVIPWKQKHSVSKLLSAHRNGYSLGKPYSGINAFLTAFSGYSSPHWYSRKQLEEIGGKVKDGEKGLPIIYFNFIEKENEEKTDTDRIPFARYTLVFNFDQCENLPETISGRVKAEPQSDPLARIDACEKIVDEFKNAPTIENADGTPCYRPMTDTVSIPKKEYFESVEYYYQVLFHELGHSTGHESRLKRTGVTDPVKFGSHNYSKEELIAELTAAFLCAKSGIDAKTEENSVGYLSAWLKVLKADPKMLVQAASAAQKAADYILNKNETKSEE